MDAPPPLDETELLRNLAWVQGLARRLVADPVIAEEVAQETWLLALERPPARVRGGPGLRAWLARVTRTVARQRFRSEQARSLRERRAALDRDEQPAALDVVARAEMQQRLAHAVLALDEPARTTVLLRYFDGLDTRAIARRVGETPVVVRKRLSRAIQTLRARLGAELGDGEGGLSRALAPLAFAGGRAGAVKVIGGAIVSMSKVNWAVGAAVAAAVVGGVWLWLDAGPIRRAEPDRVPGAGEAAAAAPGGDEQTTVAAGELAVPERSAASRRAGLGVPSYLVLDFERGPVAGARVVLCADGEVVLEGETGAAGVLEGSEERRGEGRLLVLADGFAPQTHEVSMKPGRHEVVLDRGAVVSGRLVVGGGPPAERIPLQLFSHVELVRADEELGLAWAALTPRPNPGRLIETRADELGAFRIAGLPEGASFEMVLPLDYRLEDPTLAAEHSPNRMPLEAPAEDLTIRVVKRLAITGRVVQIGGKPAPVAGTVVDARLDYPEVVYPGPHLTLARTDDEGRFRIALLSPELLGGSIWISAPDRTFAREVPIEAREVTEDWDLGDLPLTDLGATQTVRLRVLDAEHVPLTGAIAATGASAPISAPTDAEGRTTLSGVVPGLSTIGVYAAGYEATDVAVPAEPPEVLEVVLPRGTLLELEFLTPDGEPAPSVKARIAAPRHPYRSAASPRNYHAYTGAGCTFYQTRTPEGEGVVVRLNALREGRVVLNDLLPGLPFQLRVEGPFGHPIQELEIAPLAPGEHRTLEVHLTQVPRTLRGRVLDEAWNPLPGATIGIRHPTPDYPGGGSQTHSRSTEEDGSFEQANVYSPVVFLFVEADGYVPVWNERFEVPEEGRIVEFRLRPAHVVTVTVEDEASRRLPARLNVHPPTGATAFGKETGKTGVYVLHGLPDEEVEVTAYVYGAPHVRTCDPCDPELLIRVPVLGRVTARVYLFEELSVGGSWLVCLVPESGSGQHEVYARIDPTGRDPAVFPGVLPGRYDAVVRRYPEGFADMQRFEEESPTVPVEVVADAEVTIELKL